jgi:hypothetical protein
MQGIKADGFKLFIIFRSKQYVMYIIRDIFQLKFGHFKDVKVLLDEATRTNLFADMNDPRGLTDFTGDSYRFVLEQSFPSLSEYEQKLTGHMATKEFQDWYGRFREHVESSHREIMKQVM